MPPSAAWQVTPYKLRSCLDAPLICGTLVSVAPWLFPLEALTMHVVCRGCGSIANVPADRLRSPPYLCDHCAQRGEPVAAKAPKARAKKRRKSKRARASESASS